MELFGGNLGYLHTRIESPDLREVVLVADDLIAELRNTFPRFRIRIFDVAHSVYLFLLVIKGFANHESSELIEEVAEGVEVASELWRATIK
jgi:hypothetical protein